MRVTKRQLLTATGTTLAGATLLLTTHTQPTQAQIQMGTLSIQGDTKTLDTPPSRVSLTVTGSWELTGSPPDQTRVVLQVENSSVSRDMDEVLELDSPMSGQYTLQAELLDHPEITGQKLLPANVGETLDTEIVVRCILLAISDGAIQAEEYVEDTATLALTKDGLKLSLSGEGSVEVSA